MKKQLLKIYSINLSITFLLCFFLFVNNQLSAQITIPTWTFATGGGNGSWEHGMAIKCQGTDVYMFARYSNAPTVSTVTPTSVGGTGSAVFKLNSAGVGVWAAGNQGLTTDTYAWGFSIDGLGNCYSGGTVNSGSSPGYISKTNSVGTIVWRRQPVTCGATDATVSDVNGVWGTGGYTSGAGITHYDQSGNLRYNTQFITASGQYVVGKGLALWNGFLYVCGGYRGTPTFAPMFGAGASIVGPANPGPANMYYIAQYDTTSGTCVRVLTFANAGATSWGDQADIMVDAAGNIYCSGYFTGTANFQGTTLVSAGSNDIFVAKLNNAGVLQWVTQSGGTGNDNALSLALDNQGNVYTAGQFQGTCTFDMLCGCQTYTAPSTYQNGYVAKYDNATGQVLWVKRATSAQHTQFYGVAVDNNYNVWVTGSYSDNASATFDAITLPGYTAGGDIFVSKLDQSPTKNIIPVVSTSPYNTSTTYSLPYQLKPGASFTPGNVFMAEISDAAGNFTGGQITIGSVVSTTAGTITITIPAGLASGTYKIRILSTTPVDVSDPYCVKIANVIVLPVELLNFTGKDQGATNLIEWNTSSEKDNDYFTLERSFDAQTFESIGVVKGAGTSSVTNHYSLIDEHPYQHSYYRLKQTDMNGDVYYSKVILIAKGGGLDIVNIYPNPVSDNFQYTVSSSEDTQVKVRVVDVLGKELIVQPKVDLVKGMNHLSIDASTLSKGSYFIQIETTTGEVFRTQKKLMAK